MCAFFKQVASAVDLRDVQSAVLWEWAVSSTLPLPEAAARFSKTYRSFWPLLQLGDPWIQEDRMFSVDQRDVLIILRRLEERYGKYDTGSTTEIPLNIFQHFAIAKVGHGPVWVRNTQSSRLHVESILRKYAVGGGGPKRGLYMPSCAPGVRMIEMFKQRSFVAKPREASIDERAYKGPEDPASAIFTVSLAAEERSARRAHTSSQGSLFSESNFSSASFSPLGMPLGSPQLNSPSMASLRGSPTRLGSPLRRALSPPSSPGRGRRSPGPGGRTSPSLFEGNFSPGRSSPQTVIGDLRGNTASYMKRQGPLIF